MTIGRWLVISGVAALAAVPLFGSATLVQYGISALSIAALAQAWNILGGYTGYASFGNSVFYGLGAYGTAIAMVDGHQSFGVGLGCGVVLAVVCALLFGGPILRLRGPYFAIATLGLSGAMSAVVSNLGSRARTWG
jgi:branched-chain amino acid transport system permease protein